MINHRKNGKEFDSGMADSFKAAELLGKHYGMFGGKSESGGGDVIIVDNIEKAEQIKERKNAVQS